MTLLKDRLTEDELQKLQAFKEARKDSAQEHSKEPPQSEADRERMITLTGELVLRCVECGEWDQAEFRKMMDKGLTRPADRALFGLA
jgi:hypothetical protein